MKKKEKQAAKALLKRKATMTGYGTSLMDDTMIVSKEMEEAEE